MTEPQSLESAVADRLAERLIDTEERLEQLAKGLRKLVRDPIYARAVVQETATTTKTVLTDPTPLILASDVAELLIVAGR